MAASRHRGSRARARTPLRSARTLVAALVAVLLLGSLAAVRALGRGGDDAPTARTFTGVVSSFADDGDLMCVRRPGSEAPFCDLYYVPPDTPRIEVGDRVLVSTITSRDEDGSRVSGMLVSPLP